MNNLKPYLGKKFFTFAFAATISIILYAFRSWLHPYSILAKSDWGYATSETLRAIHLNYYSLWLPDNLGRVVIDVGQAPSYSLYGLFSKYLDFPFGLSEKLIHLWPALVISFFGTFFLSKKIFNNKLSALISSVTFLLNTYNLDLYTGNPTTAAAFSLFPLLFLILIEYLEAPSLRMGVIFGLVGSVATGYEPRATIIMILTLSIYTIIDFVSKRSFGYVVDRLKFLSVPSFILLFLNIYWVLGLSKLGALKSNDIFNKTLFGNGYWNILHSISLHFPWWSSSGVTVFQNQPIDFYFWIIPFLAFLGFLLNSKNIKVVSFGVISLVGILFSKQAANPLPDLYLWIFNNVPGFKIYRVASPFYSLIGIGYAILLGALVSRLCSDSNKYSFKPIYKYSLTLLILFIFLLNTKPLITGQIGTLFVPRYIPNDYQIYNKFIDNQNEDFRAIFVPRGSQWVSNTGNHSKLSDTDLITSSWLNLSESNEKYKSLTIQDQVMSILQRPFSEDLLNTTSFKYVVVPLQDFGNDDNFYKDYGEKTNPNIRQWYINQLDKIFWLKKIDISTKDLVVYENENSKPLISSFKNLFTIDSVIDLDRKYHFINLNLKGKFYFALGTTSTPSVHVTDLFENVTPSSFPLNIYGFFATSSFNLSSANSVYVSHGAGEVLGEIKGGKLVLRRGYGGVLDFNNFAQIDLPNSAVATVPVDSNDQYISLGTGLFGFDQFNKIDLGRADTATTSIIYSAGSNLVPNGSFEDGLWQKTVGDCNAYDDRSVISMNLEGSLGSKNLELSAANHTACTSEDILVGAGTYVFTFDYQSPNAENASYYIGMNNSTSSAISSSVPVNGTNWQHYLTKIVLQEGTTKINLTLYAHSSDGDTSIVNRYDNVSLRKLSNGQTIHIPAPFEYEKTSLNALSSSHGFSYIDRDFSYQNLITNGSFENGLWKTKPGDCNGYDNKPTIGMRLNTKDASVGKNSLELSATRHSACTGTSVPVTGNHAYLVSFDYQTPNAQSASYYFGLNDKNATIYSEDLMVSDTKWHTFSKVITAPADATGLSITLYAKESNGTTNIINRYDNVSVVEVPNLQGAFYTVSDPDITLVEPQSVTFDLINPTKKLVHIKGATTSFYLAFSESYHPSWQLEMNNEKILGLKGNWTPWAHPDKVAGDQHFALDGFLNGWYVNTRDLCEVRHLTGCTQNPDGSWDIEMIIEFWPQRWFYLGLLISGTTLISCLGYLSYAGIQSLRRKRIRNNLPIK